MPLQPHEGWLMTGTLEVCAPPAVTSPGRAKFFALTLFFHEDQLIFIYLLLCWTGMFSGLIIVTTKHGLRICHNEVWLGVGDNCAILDFSQRHLTGHSWTYLRNFWFCRIFFHAKLPPRTAKTIFENPIFWKILGQKYF